MHTPVESLKGKRILITGGTTGIGQAIAILLGSYGARILTFGRHEEPLQEALADIRAVGATAEELVADSSHADDVKRVFQFIDEVWSGELDVLINSAAVGAGALAEMSDEEWQYVIAS